MAAVSKAKPNSGNKNLKADPEYGYGLQPGIKKAPMGKKAPKPAGKKAKKGY